MINIQGLTKAKYLEVEDILNEENTNNIICITETQQKIDKTVESKGVKKHIAMRNMDDKKGGGLMILYREEEKMELKIEKSRSKDILDMKGNVMNKSVRLILAYLDCGIGNEAKVRNKLIIEEIENKLENTHEEAVMVLVDFNAHMGYLGYQIENENGRIVKELLNRQSLILLNSEEKCKGTYTWQRGEQKVLLT